MRMLFLLLALCVFAGCTQGMIRASSIKPAVDLVVKDYVKRLDATEPLYADKKATAEELKATVGSGCGRWRMTLDELKDLLNDTIREGTADLLGGLGTEYTEFAEKITTRLVECAAKNDSEGIDWTLARLHLLDERIRIKANDLFWSSIRTLVSGLFRFLTGIKIPEIEVWS